MHTNFLRAAFIDDHDPHKFDKLDRARQTNEADLARLRPLLAGSPEANTIWLLSARSAGVEL